MKANPAIDLLIELYEKQFGEVPSVESVAGGGSSRQYYRLKSNGSPSIIGAFCEDISENKTFIELDRVFVNEKLPVPQILAINEDYRAYLLQDLGNISLFEELKTGDKILFAKNALKTLIEFQTVPENKWAKLTAYSPFNERQVRWDLNYFKYDFLKPSGVFFDEAKLEDDFDKFVHDLLDYNIKLNGFMYRDFQSRNIMIDCGKLWMIDFQGGRKGPVVYDAVSFLWQARSPFSYEEKRYLADYYCELAAHRLCLPESEIKSEILPFTLFRTLQVLGAYGLRGIIEKKSHFIESIPFAIKNLKYLRNKGVLDRYPEIKKISQTLDSSAYTISEPNEGLTVTVFSFSYKKGYPIDLTGNGGGFMFDCRGMHNPGRYNEFKNLTGKDPQVKEFLASKGECLTFVNNALTLVNPTIENYINRGFNSLQIGFGCTGGQHRSVYCAELFSDKLKSLFPEIIVKTVHRENICI